MAQDIKKASKVKGNNLKIPTETDIQEYINNKIKELNGQAK